MDKIVEFIKNMKERGYIVFTDNGELGYVIRKDNFHNVSLKEEMIIKAPLEYLIEFVEHEFELLEKKARG